MSDDRRPTLQTVAARAAVSRQTVSNALNAPHLVHPDTLERVLGVVAEVGYRPHGAARQLRTRRSRVIGLRLEPTANGISGAVLDRFLHAVTEQAQLRGYRVMLFTAPDDEAEIGQYGELVDVLGVDAFVVTSTHHGDPRTRWLRDNDLPFVTFGRPWGAGPDDPDAPDDGGPRLGRRRRRRRDARRDRAPARPRPPPDRLHRLAARLGRGRRPPRRLGARDAPTGLDDAAIGALTMGVVDGVGTGAAAAERLLAAAGPTAFVCASDSLALGALSTARSLAAAAHGNQPAVVGFDDTPVAQAVGLSSVAQPLTEAAGRAFGLLMDQVEDRSPASRDRADGGVLLSPSLVVRDSSAHRRPPP